VPNTCSAEAVVDTPWPAPLRVIEVRRVEASADAARVEEVAVEVPVSFVFNGRSFAVMLASPGDFEDFARGFSLTEDVVDEVADLRSIEVRSVERGVEVHVAIPQGLADRLAQRRRALAGRSGCGVCGADGFAEALRPVRRVASDEAFAPAAIRRAVASLGAHQALNRRIGAVHAAAFADATGRIVVAREDVGRHNALDKLIGALAVMSIARSTGFVVVSSRCSYEMVHKTAAAGIGLIAAVSAPTSLAIDLAGKVGVGLLAFAREGRFTVYAGGHRIVA
jgi:FdhD protein